MSDGMSDEMWELKDPDVADALQKQVGGDHYKQYQIQPVEFITINGIGFLEGNVVKYVARHQDKNGADDIRKAIHYCELILSLHYGEHK
jgi:hypothetical protein